MIAFLLTLSTHCKNKIDKIINLSVSTVARNNGNCKLLGRVGCHDYINILMLSNRYTN